MARNTVIVNAFAGPGAGKSTSAWEIAAELKKKGLVVEYVPEYAKELVWDENFTLLDQTYDHQMQVYQEQKHRIDRLMGKVDVIVTDSPIIMSVNYISHETNAPEQVEAYNQMAINDFKNYHTFNYFIERGSSYEQEGRIQTLEESKEIDKNIKSFLHENNIYFGSYNHKTLPVIVKNVVAHCQKQSELEARRVDSAPINASKTTEQLMDDLYDMASNNEITDLSRESPNGEKKQWIREAQVKRENMYRQVTDIADNYSTKPENMYELLEFGSRFYHYSARNTMLIQANNRGATYVQSFQAWKKQGYSVKKGEKGIPVYVPVKATVLKVGDKLIPLEQASKEERAKWKAGEIKSNTELHYRIGTVFDISQTNFPPEKYPEMFHMGYSSEKHAELVKALSVYAKNVLNYTVKEEDLTSISRRGYCDFTNRQIVLNQLLNDTQKLSTLSHEIGHAMMHEEARDISKEQKEFEADGVSIMLSAYLGLEIPDTRKSHLAASYNTLKEKNPDVALEPALNNVYKAFRRLSGAGLDQILDQHVPIKKSIAERAPVKEMPERSKRYGLSNEEIYDLIKQQVRITDYAESLGFTLKRVGRYITLKEHDSVRIDPERNCFWRNSGIGDNSQGSVIDFSLHFAHNGDMKETLQELSNLVDTDNYSYVNQIEPQRPQPQKKEKKELQLPEKSENMRRVFAYLTKTRFIDPDIVQEMVDQKMLYQDQRGNCVFVAYDDNQKPNFACKRGTLSDKRFMGDVPGSDYTKDFYINNQAQKLIVTESVIDAMSTMSILKGQGYDVKDYDYLALTGTGKYESIINHLQTNPKEEVLLCLDSDAAGIESTIKIQELIAKCAIETEISLHMPKSKDWNQDLTNVASKLKTMDQIQFLESRSIKDVIPKHCAVESTKDFLDYEKKFRPFPDGQDKFRLVTIDEKNMTLTPISDQTSLSEKGAIKLLPEGYKLVSYDELTKEISNKKFEKIVVQSQERSEEPEPDGKSHRAETHDKHIIGFLEEQGTICANIKLPTGETTIENICKNQDNVLCYMTGLAVDNNLEYNLLSESEQQELESFQKEHPEIEFLPIQTPFDLSMNNPEAANRQENKGMSAMDHLRQRELQKDDLIPSIEAGVEIAM